MNQKIKCLDSFHLRVLAMVCMVCSHMSSTILWGRHWLDSIGRLAFPIFAFLLTEGFRHTSNVKKYMLRLFLFALITELPFNLMSEGGLFYPFHQNVLFTFCIALLMMIWIEKAKGKSKLRFILRAVLAVIVGYLLGFILFVDYFGYGILMVLTFYLFHKQKYGWIAELAIMVYVNWELIGGLVFPTMIFGHEINIPQQGFAIIALIPIWLYNGEKKVTNRKIQDAYYAFYPAHMLILWILLQFQIHFSF